MAEELTKYIEKIKSAKTNLSPENKDFQWMEGFNHGLEWAVRILTGDKSAS